MAKTGEISKVNLSEIKRTFELLDKNKDNKLSAAEFVRGGKMMKVKLTNEEAKEMIAKNDTDEYAEYELLMKGLLEKIDKERAMCMNNFKKYDQDNSGFINFHELKNVLGDKWKMSDGEIQEHFEKADVNNDGRISFKEFKRYLCEL